MSKLSAIILAAGQSKRMGYPKALLQFGEKTFIETIYDNLSECGIKDIIIILGGDANIIKKNIHNKKIVINKKYPDGQLSSFQAGLKTLATSSEGVILTLIDQPQINVHIMQKIISCFKKYPDNIIIPTCNGERGHPTIFPKSIFFEIMNTPTSLSTSFIIKNNAALVKEVELNDERILKNFNTKQDLQNIDKYL